MRRGLVLAGFLGGVAAAWLWVYPAAADSVSIGIGTEHVNIGVQIGAPPQLVVVPGTPVYRAPALPYNYFFYSGHYYLYHQDRWLIAASHNGPWTVVALERVPRPLLTVPVEYYKVRPAKWKNRHGPPPWAEAKGHHKERGEDKHARRDRHENHRDRD